MSSSEIWLDFISAASKFEKNFLFVFPSQTIPDQLIENILALGETVNRCQYDTILMKLGIKNHLAHNTAEFNGKNADIIVAKRNKMWAFLKVKLFKKLTA